MSEWISVKDQVPNDRQQVRFLHDGFEFFGAFIHKEWPFGSPLEEPHPWFFSGQQEENGGTVHTVHVTHWQPLTEPPEGE